MRALALFIGRHAARVIDPLRPEQAAAMYAEIENLDDSAALRWALGCLVAAYRQRASAIAVAVVSARLFVGLAAGVFGAVHLIFCVANLYLKLAIMNGASLTNVGPVRLRLIDAMPLQHWVIGFAVLGMLGVLYACLAVALATGRSDRVCRHALALVVAPTAFQLVGLPGLTWPVLYVVLALLMAALSFGLSWLWAWDERRMARA